ncbi:transcription elongation factor TFIIS, partial [Tanacetum coccineum]
ELKIERRIVIDIDGLFWGKGNSTVVLVVVLITKGDRPHTDEAFGSDLDGDLYIVTWDEHLIPPSKQSWPPMEFTATEAKKLPRDARHSDIIDFFTKNMVNDSLGTICNAHVVHADMSDCGALDEKCIKLAELASIVHWEIEDELRDDANAADPYRVAVSVESAMFEKWGRSNGAQKLKYRSIMFNIKDPKNQDFRRKVLLGYVKPERILELTPEEMVSTERQMEIGKIKWKALFDCERGLPPKATTDEFICGRCGKRKCTYYQLQTRSADEPMTTFVTCVNYDNHWKFY